MSWIINTLSKLQQQREQLPKPTMRDSQFDKNLYLDKLKLDLEINALEYDLNQIRIEREILFIEAYYESGGMCAIRDDGTSIEGKPVSTGNSMQDMWNVRSEARHLAHWSTL